MYTVFVSFVLFDARGDIMHIHPFLIPIAAVSMAIIMPAIKYLPIVFHRPQMIESLCDDVLAIVTHAACMLVIHDPSLQYACALHSACYLMRHRFLGNIHLTPSHMAMALVLLAAYIYGPRISELKPFLTAMAFPSLAEALANILEYMRKLLVVWIQTECI